MARRRASMLVIACLALCALAAPAWGATPFRPRIGRALGLMPPLNSKGQFRANDVATGTQTPALYHGGQTMTGGVTVHTIFWAPSGYAFQGQPSGAPAGYEGMLQQFFTDVAHDSSPVATGSCTTSECDVFTVEGQYGWGTTPGGITAGNYGISYSVGADSIDDTDPYPPVADQCASPNDAFTCVTDGQVAAEIDKLAPTSERGLNNLWIVFLPPNVDECIDPGSCGTNAFAAYHSVFNLNGHGATIYAIAIDPVIEYTVPPGADPEGSPDAEATIDAIAHETNEAMSDPEGTGWMDPNGFEIADKCEFGPELGTPLGFAGDGSPYNQVINGHQYLIQEMWSNADGGCVQATSKTTNALPLPQVDLRQYDPVVTGNTENNTAGIGVQVKLVRLDPSGSAVTVAQASTTTAADGSWSVSLTPHAPGDDQDQIDVNYSGAGAPTPHDQVILTGNGGNPFTESGWIGWFDMDNGSAAANASGSGTLTLGPCFQTGELSATFDGSPLSSSPTSFCDTQTDAAAMSTSAIHAGDVLTWTSLDNRAFSDPNGATPNTTGSLVSLTVPVGEAGAPFCAPETDPCAQPFSEPLPYFTPGGLANCTADLELQAVACTGLVAGANYTLIDGRQRVPAMADTSGTIVTPMSVKRGDSIALSNGSRTLTTLHVAHLKVAILGDGDSIAAGTCQAGDYFGAPLSSPPTSTAAGVASTADNGGVALTGVICPASGKAAGLPTDVIAQTDDLSGGQTETEVPDLQDTSPADGEDVGGKFTLQATSGLSAPGNLLIPTDASSQIAVTVYPLTGGSAVFMARNVDTAKGVSLSGLAPGAYGVVWTLTDANGDSRIDTTRFNEESLSVPQAKVSCKFAGASRVSCAVKFPQLIALAGRVSVRLTRAGKLVGLGHAKAKKGKATVTMAKLASVSRGSWRVTLTLSRPHLPAQKIRLSLARVR